MINPQLENGYTRIANEILEKLATFRISGEEWMILLTILRKTYGFRKIEDKISISQFYEATGLAKPSICRAVNKLIKKNIISKKATTYITLYRFNKLFNTWKPVTKKRLINNAVNAISNIANKRLQKSDIQKKKETITKENSNTNVLLAMFEKINPSYKQLFINRTQRDSLNRLISRYGEKWVSSLISKLPEITSKPYAPRITTPYELESKLGQLKVFLEQEKSKATRTGSVKV